MDTRLINQFEVDLKVAVDYIEKNYTHPNLYWLSDERLRANPDQLVSQLFQTQDEAKEIFKTIQMHQPYPQLNQFYRIVESNHVKGQFRIVVDLAPFIKTLQQLKKLTAIQKFLNLMHCSSSTHQWQINSLKPALIYMQPCAGYLLYTTPLSPLRDITQFSSKAKKFGFTPDLIAKFRKHTKTQIEKAGTFYSIEDENFLEELFKLAIAADVLHKNLLLSTTHALINAAFANRPNVAKRKFNEIDSSVPKFTSLPNDIVKLIAQYLSLVDIGNMARVCAETNKAARDCFTKSEQFRTHLGLFSNPTPVLATVQQPGNLELSLPKA